MRTAAIADAPRAHSATSRRAVEFAPALLVLSCVIWSAVVLFVSRPVIGDFVDDGTYFVSARALRDGTGYVLPSRPDTPRATKYPIGFPLALSLLMRATDGSLSQDTLAFKWLTVAAGCLFAFCGYRWIYSLTHSSTPAWLVVVATLFHPAVLQVAVACMSELPYMALCSALLMRWTTREAVEGWLPLAVDGALVALAITIRTQGVAWLLAALYLAWTSADRRKAVAAVAAGATPILMAGALLATWPAASTASGSYISELRAAYGAPAGLVRVPLANLGRMAEALCSVVAPLLSWTRPGARLLEITVLAVLFSAGLALVLARGLARLLSAGPRVRPALAYTAVTAAIFAVWPWAFDLRFGVSLLPVLLLALASGVESLHLMPASARRYGMVTTLAAGLVCSVIVDARIVEDARAHHGKWVGGGVDPTAALESLREKTSADAVIASSFPEMVWLQTARQGVLLVEHDDQVGERWDNDAPLVAWLERVKDRPLFLLVRPSSPLDARKYAQLRSSPRFLLDESTIAPDFLLVRCRLNT